MIKKFFLRIRSDWAPAEFTRPGGYGDIWKIAAPLIFMHASNIVMMLCNRAFLAHNSLEDLTAAVSAGQLFFCSSSFFLITTSFTGTIVAQHYGNRDRESCVRSAWNGFYFGILVSLVLTVALPLFGDWIFHFGKLSEGIKIREADYFRVLTPSAAFGCMEAPFLTYFTAIGRARTVATVKFLSCCLSVPLNYIMIFGKCGLPALGGTGAALASTTAGLFSVLLVIVLFLVQNQKEWPSRTCSEPVPSILWKLLAYGSPGGFQTSMRSASFACVLFFFGFLGDEALTAASIPMTINNIAFIPLLGLMDAASVITGRFIGERRIQTAARISGRCMRLLSLYMIFMGSLYILCPDMLIRLFAPPGESAMNAAEIIRAARIILLIQIVQNFTDGLRFIVAGSLRGAGDTKIPFLLSLATTWLVQIPLAGIFTIFIPVPIWAAWFFALFVYSLTDAIVMQLRKNTGAWKRIKLIDLSPGTAEDA